MKALVLKKYNELIYTDVPDPEIKVNEVLIRVKACGICGSDVHGVDGSTGRRIPPVIMGHEASGVIEKTGSHVKNYKPGDRVTFDSTIYCGKCYYCRKGIINLCDNRRVLGVSCDEYRQDGAFAEYVAVPEHILYPIPDGVSFEQAAMVEPLSIAFHALRRVPPMLNETALVVGVGIIGLYTVQLLKTAGCATVIASDIDNERLLMAKKLGADYILKADETDVSSQVYNLSDGRGADIAFEAVGMSGTVNTALNSLRKGGRLALIGNYTPEINFHLQRTVVRQISIYGSCASSGEYPDCMEMIAVGKVDVDSLTSAVAPLSEGAIWFRKLYEKEKGLYKVILVP